MTEMNTEIHELGRISSFLRKYDIYHISLKNCYNIHKTDNSKYSTEDIIE